MMSRESGGAPPEAEMAAGPAALKASMADTAAPASVAEPPARSRIYSASLELEVPRVEETRIRIEELTEEAGGRVEGIHPGGIVVLVPAAELFAVLDGIEALGTVLDRSLEAWDVTDSLADLETRLNLAVEARERLYRLLEQADETEERVAILREIRRLSEQIESYRITLETMRERVAFSRISILLRSSLGDSRAALEAIPFPWMRNLDPFGVTPRPPERQLQTRSGTEVRGFQGAARRRSLLRGERYRSDYPPGEYSQRTGGGRPLLAEEPEVLSLAPVRPGASLRASG